MYPIYWLSSKGGTYQSGRLFYYLELYYRECALKSAADCVEIQAGGMSKTV